MSDLAVAVTTLITLYALVTGIFLISENRRPQTTLAWMLAFLFVPGIGVLAYVFFGRHRKAFSKQSRLLKQDLEATARPILAPMMARQDEAIDRLGGRDGRHRKLMRLVRRNSRSALTIRNRVEIQQNAERFYPSLMEDLAAARYSIHLQYFIWAADGFTEQLKEILVARARAGVQVRLLYDAVGSHAHLTRAYLRELRAAGVVVAPTSPLYRLHTISYRNHRKITVIDGRIGYTGGMNMSQEHLDGGKGFDSWRDTQLRFTGEAVAVLQAVFMVDWYNAVREDLFGEAHFPKPVSEPEDGEEPLQILTSGPDSRWAAIRQLYFAMIGSAERHVFLQSPYFILDASLAEVLKAAALAGVDVRVMLSARPSGNPLPDWAGNTYIVDAVNAGVRVFLYETGYLHAKTISVDSTVCSIGSANIDIRSFSINYELNAVLYSERLARELEDSFVRDLECCREFSVAEYEQRNILLRFRDSAARLLSPLL
ncbi:cardiolipin synthase [Geminicoccus harenae]|uniref:cardiolipin synthase n=1 Tax=Geminicoccus harenae TaxID=2498453 RepID=UPI00168A538E|nr:cardiolipin synthase [Geminicoccus harenae]